MFNQPMFNAFPATGEAGPSSNHASRAHVSPSGSFSYVSDNGAIFINEHGSYINFNDDSPPLVFQPARERTRRKRDAMGPVNVNKMPTTGALNQAAKPVQQTLKHRIAQKLNMKHGRPEVYRLRPWRRRLQASCQRAESIHSLSNEGSTAQFPFVHERVLTDTSEHDLLDFLINEEHQRPKQANAAKTDRQIRRSFSLDAKADRMIKELEMKKDKTNENESDRQSWLGRVIAAAWMALFGAMLVLALLACMSIGVIGAAARILFYLFLKL